ncbi:L,D-transpeptidase family protein [Oricola sp.]|uniref:L,D-transpeptidase family protein n=1 Tax=Oricola sp. TaxID=1979950 RepID=UPI003BACABF6
MKRFTAILIATVIALPALPEAVPVAKSQSLVDLLFNGERRAKRKRQRQVTVKRAPRKIARISSPRYYTYSAAPLTTVAVASMLPAATVDTLEPSLDFETKRFAEAAALSSELRLPIEKEIADALKAHYADNPTFIWSRGSAPTGHARAVAALFAEAGDHALVAADYDVPIPPDGWSMDAPAARAAELLEFEMLMSARAVRYAMDMRDGVILPNKLSGYHDFPRARMTAAEAIAGLAEAEDPVLYLKSLEPQHPAYGNLKRELAALRAEEVEEIVIPKGTFARLGQTEEALPLIMKALRRKATEETRAKHAATFAEYMGDDLYDEAIVALVRDFQRDNGLSADGIIGKNTVRYLTDVGHSTKIDRIELALERMRWHPEEFGERHVQINQPAYRATYSENFQDTLPMRAIVGKKANQTSFFHDEIEMVVYNPYWGVPQSIIVNEMLPRLYRDPGYLDRAGYVVTNASGKRIASANVNWGRYAGKVPYNVRQKPGPKNALGELKILFPNKHAIYMHDTPSRNLFGNEQRALSHGCVRLQKPREMAAAVLGKSVDHVVSHLGGYEHQEDLEAKVPVYISYYTAWPTDDGTVEYFPDIYDRDMYLGRAVQSLRKVREIGDA